MALGAGEIAVAGLAGKPWTTTDRWEFVGLGLAESAVGLFGYLHRPDSEHLRDTLVHGLASGRDPGQVVAEVDTQLHRLAISAHTTVTGGAALSFGGRF
ncbi:MAG TPA: hypothetical protein VHW23_14000 [Kofleriaceae bacterium]|jgi:hypothetical protein|nr:hypothetical protein [Kofleriaceae bacterium]